MPYTPPSHGSPSASKTNTPTPSRTPSYLHTPTSPAPVMTSDRPQLPRSSGSSSYLNKHRRSPSTPTNGDDTEVMTDVQRGIALDPYGSLRQSPPPVTNGLIPNGMTISPPDSSHNSDDEDLRGRARELERENLAELQAAIRSIDQRGKSGSPVRYQQEESDKSQNGTPPEGQADASQTRPPLSSSQRKISHSRSSTDSNIVLDQSPSPGVLTPCYQQDTTSDSEESDEPNRRPPMVRKKSGELVRPALRPPSRRRPSSMPGTPTYSKAVHFDSHLEHVRHFLQVDRPLAVSAGSSPVEAYESENEFPFGSDDTGSRSRQSYEWEIKLANFPPESLDRRHLPVHVERVFLSADKQNLIGSVAVQNLSFQKFVVARFTLDYWKTTSEVTAEYSNDVRRKDQHDNMDKFTFSIRLADQANLANKTLFFCVRYNVNGNEYWDSNNGINYQVDFARKPKSKPATSAPGLGARPLSALPRSRPTSGSASVGRPKSMPMSFDDFATGFDNLGSSFGQGPGVLMGEPKIKLRSPKSKSELVPDAPARKNTSGPLFGHRYDFNSSLSAARNNAYSVLGEQSGLLPLVDTKQSSRQVPAMAVNGVNGTSKPSARTAPSAVRGPSAVVPPVAPAKPSALVSEKPPLTSQSYQELVDKYCFFGSAAKSPSSLSTSTAGDSDSSNEEPSGSDLSAGSSPSSGSSTPVLGCLSPPLPSDTSAVKISSPQLSRSSSPMPSLSGSCMTSRSDSPARFASRRYLQTSSAALLAEAPLAAAIQG